MIKRLKKRLRGDIVERDLSFYFPILQNIRKREADLMNMSDSGLRDLSRILIKRGSSAENVKSVVAEAFALVSEASFRTLHLRPFDTQIIAALCLNDGKVIEMQTGEGKTLAATMPAYWNAIIGDGVHIHTFNDYLARRDAQWMGPIYEFLGLSVGHIQEDQSPDERRKIYKNDIVYQTAKEGGFDYLREFLVTDATEFVRRKASFAIIDEVDSTLIDEARIPLVIAGSENNNQSQDFYEVSEKIKQLQRDVDFKTDEYDLNIYLTDVGIKKVETVLKCKDLYAVENQELLTIVNLALQAEHLLNRDVDYIVRDGIIELVDEFTGRVMDNRKWPHGLQAAIEAKELLEIQKEGKIRGKTTLQHFFSSYHKICGMTGTALASAEEFLDFYGLKITVIPYNKPLQRVDRADKVFFSKEQKWSAVVEEIRSSSRLTKKCEAPGSPCRPARPLN